MAGLGEFLFGRKDKFSKKSLLTPEQQTALQDYFSQGIQTNPLYQQGQSYLQNILGDGQEAYNAFEQPLMQKFQEQIAPGIAERFAGAGTGSGALNSSGFQNSLAQAGRGLASDLGAQRAGLQQYASAQALPYSQQPYSNQLGGLGVRGFENVYQPGTQGFLAPALGGLAAGLSGGAGLGLGASLGSSLFGGGQSAQGRMNRPTGILGMGGSPFGSGVFGFQ